MTDHNGLEYLREGPIVLARFPTRNESASETLLVLGVSENLSLKSFSVDVDMRRVTVCSMAPTALVRASPLFTIAFEKQTALVLVPPSLSMRCGGDKGLPPGCAVF
jgi:hypothetical protein